MRELTASVHQDARRTQLRRLAQTYRENVDLLITALMDDHLGDLAHQLSGGASVPRERQGKVIGRALLAGAGGLALLLGELDGAEAAAVAEAQRQDLAARRADVRARVPEERPADPGRALVPGPGPRLLAVPGAEWERD